MLTINTKVTDKVLLLVLSEKGGGKCNTSRFMLGY